MNVTKSKMAIPLKNNGKVIMTKTGLIIDNADKNSTPISFAEIEKIFIQKNKFSSFEKIRFFTIATLVLISIAIYCSIEITFIALFLSIPAVVSVLTLKWYRLCLIQNQQLYCIKTFYQSKKQDYINLVHMVRNEMYYHQMKSIVAFDLTRENNTEPDAYSIHYYSLADDREQLKKISV